MDNWCRFLSVTLIAILVIGGSAGRELRPSEHGLAYQSNATAAGSKKSPEMLSFFGGRTSSSSAGVPFPAAKNMSDADASWWREVSGGGRRRDHARGVLVVATVVCGAVGAALLVVAAVLFLVQYRRRRSDGISKE